MVKSIVVRRIRLTDSPYRATDKAEFKFGYGWSVHCFYHGQQMSWDTFDFAIRAAQQHAEGMHRAG